MAVFTLRGLRSAARRPQGVCAGDLLVVHLTISNTRRRVGSWVLVVEEPIRRESGRRQAANAAAGSQWQAERPLSLSCPPGRSRKGAYRGRLDRARPLSTRTAAAVDAISLRAVPPHDDRGQTEPLVVLPRLGRLTRGWDRPASRVVCRQRPPRAPPRHRRRFLRPAALAERRQPPLDPWADFRPDRKTHGPPVRAAAQPRRRAAARPLAARAARAATRGERRVGREFRRHRGRRSVPQGQQQRLSGDRRARGRESAAARLGRPAARHDGAVGPGRGAQRRPPGRIVRAGRAPHRAGHRDRPGQHAAGRSEQSGGAGPAGADPVGRAMLRRLRVVDTSSPELGRYFQME